MSERKDPICKTKMSFLGNEMEFGRPATLSEAFGALTSNQCMAKSVTVMCCDGEGLT